MDVANNKTKLRHQRRGGTTHALTAGELGLRGIAVNVMLPSLTETELSKQSKTLQQVRQFAQASAFGWLGPLVEIVELMPFLASGPPVGLLAGMSA